MAFHRHGGTKSYMRVVANDGHRGGHGIDTRGSRDWAEAHLSKQIDTSDSGDTEHTLAVKKTAGHDLHFCGSPASAVHKSSCGSRNDLRVTRHSCEDRPHTSCTHHKLTCTSNVLVWSEVVSSQTKFLSDLGGIRSSAWSGAQIIAQ